MPKPLKIRLDQFLVAQGHAATREKAQALIMAGIVLVNDQKIDKSGHLIPGDSIIRLLGTPSPYVSRGGEKIESAWHTFGFSTEGKIALDVGLSTGGFTDFLFQHGAKTVFGVDVGYGQTDLKVRDNPNFVILERTNARELTHDQLAQAALKRGISAEAVDTISLVVMDVSFISVTKVLPHIQTLIRPDADYIILIKPQFEAQKAEIGKGGIVKDESIREAIIARVKTQLSTHFDCIQTCISGTKGTKGNQEYFFWLKSSPK